jgi:GNAT superfamily N-acetyltransferase
MRSRPDLESAADENLAVHATTATARLPGARVRIEPDLILADSGLPCDTFNVVCRARLTDTSAVRRVGMAIAFFARPRRPFSWWLGPGYAPANLPDILTGCGLVEAESELAMAIDLGALSPHPPVADGLTIRRVRTANELATFASLLAANWTPPDAQVIRYYALAEPGLLTPDTLQWLYLGWVGDRAVATAEATIGGGVVGIYNIGTTPQYRRRGIGLAMTHAPLIDAREAGLGTGILHAAAAGVGVYQQLGFRQFGTVTEFKPESSG